MEVKVKKNKINLKMSGDEKVEIKILVGIAKRIFDLFGHFEQSDVANEFHHCTDIGRTMSISSSE